MTSIRGYHVVSAPCCGARYARPAYLSINLSGWHRWTDGYTFGRLYRRHPSVCLCSCGAYFMASDAEQMAYVDFGDDVTEKLALESRYNALIDVQRETLDHLKEGVAVFGTDGRLRLFNSAFERIWKLSRGTLAERPHIEGLTQLARVLYDEPVTWAAIHRAVTSFTDQREPIEGQMVRPDASVIDYASTPLPDGATLLTFADVTDTKRYQRALEERNEALVVADRLKNQFIGKFVTILLSPNNTG